MTNSENPSPSNKEQEILNQKIEDQKRKIQREQLTGLINQLNEQEQKVLKLRLATAALVTAVLRALVVLELVSISCIISFNLVNTGAVPLLVLKKIPFKIPKWSFTDLFCSAADMPSRSGTNPCILWTFCNISKKVAPVGLLAFESGIIDPSMMLLVCLITSFRYRPICR